MPPAPMMTMGRGVLGRGGCEAWTASRNLLLVLSDKGADLSRYFGTANCYRMKALSLCEIAIWNGATRARGSIQNLSARLPHLAALLERERCVGMVHLKHGK